ncbi:structure-specific endonuclease subunit slx1 [Coccinella septempunctata]|uniref:structure-specific endonuclease subunit slx1 n=1 Tax=Coccinella septempunctata TaxID=41139 RepID=UPI001D08D4F3|nr:structure-specific endonuclease subunit slx1 [Coccinella septempunctata]
MLNSPRKFVMSVDAYTHNIENFYGVYLLYCKNEKFKGRVYIGYTKDPNRRIKQHNKGRKAGGAKRTSNRGPWDMVLIIHGFPNDIAALRFEWAWQHPQLSRRLKHLPRKKYKGLKFNYCIQVLSEMLCVGPWNRLPLVIRWLNQKHMRDLSDYRTPPMHMAICYGPVVSKKKEKNIEDEEKLLSSINTENICDLCHELSDDKLMNCLDNNCSFKGHLFCLSKLFLEPGEYVPVEGKCPKCELSCLWGDLVKKFKGFYSNLDVKINCDNANDFYSDSE